MKPVPDGGLPSTRGDPWQPHTCPHRLVSLAFGGWLLWGGVTQSGAVTKNKSCGTWFYALLATYPRIGLSLLSKASPRHLGKIPEGPSEPLSLGASWGRGRVIKDAGRWEDVGWGSCVHDEFSLEAGSHPSQEMRVCSARPTPGQGSCPEWSREGSLGTVGAPSAGCAPAWRP